MENSNNLNNNRDCIFCYSLLFSYLKIEYSNYPIIRTNCFLGHKKEINLYLFFDLNNKSFDKSKLKVECPFCKDLLDKDMFFICIETNQLICPKCIALNIIILSSKGKKKKLKKSNNKQPHYVTLISLLKESIKNEKEKINLEFLNEKLIEEDKIKIISKYNEYKDIIIDENSQKYLDNIYNFIININNIQKKAIQISKENYLSNYFYENMIHLSFHNNIKDIFINNFSIENKIINFKELKNIFQILYEKYKNKKEHFLFSNILNSKKENEVDNRILKCIYQQESIISHLLYFNFEVNENKKEKYLIVSSNNGIINILEIENYKSVYILDIFQGKGIYHLIQCYNEKNTFYASSWGCFKKIKLNKERNKELSIDTFNHKVIKTFKKSDIIRILKLIEIPKNNNIQNNIISLDEGGHIISWGYNEGNKKETKEEIFVADREDSINNMILFLSNKLRDMLIFTTRNSTLLGSIYFFNIKDGFYELKCLKNKYKSTIISFDLQYNNLTQINDYMIAFPQNKKLIFVDVKSFQITTIIEIQTELIRDKFYNIYGETIKIINIINKENKYLLIISSKGFIFQYYINKDNEREIKYLGKFKFYLKEEIESLVNSSTFNQIYQVDLKNDKIYLKLNKKILLLNLNYEI